MIILPRRRLLGGLVSLLATPAIVRADALMRVSVPRRQRNIGYDLGCRNGAKIFLVTNIFLLEWRNDVMIFGDVTTCHIPHRPA